MPESSFTALEFIEVSRSLYPGDWELLVERSGQFGEKRRYTVVTYLGNRLDSYSRKTGSLLLPLTRYSEDKFKDYRRTTEEERKHFGALGLPCSRGEGKARTSKEEDRGTQENQDAGRDRA